VDHWVVTGLGFYMSAAVLSYVALLFLSFRADHLYQRSSSRRTMRVQALSRGVDAPAVVIVAPAKNEEAIIGDSVDALLGIAYPNLSLLVVDDGSTDRTFAILESKFRLVKLPTVPKQTLRHKPITGVWKSLSEPRLTVVQKVASGGSKGCANNAALEVVTAPLVFATDIDSIVEPDAVTKMVARMEETGAVAIGCPLRPWNGCTVRDGIVQTKLPRNYWATSQVVEYLRTFQLRHGWACLGMLSNISGAAGLFRVEALRAIGGYRPDTTAEDLASTFAFHLADLRIAFEPSTNVYTQVPETWQSLKSQRKRWARGLFDILWDSRRILGVTHGRYALLAAWFWLFELVEPFVEVAGLAVITRQMIIHDLSPWVWAGLFACLFLTAMLSAASILQTERLYGRFSTADTLKIVLLSTIEIAPFKIPLGLGWRIAGTFAYLTGNTTWEALPRRQFHEQEASI